MFGLLYHEPLQYQNYKYPVWAEWIGWSLALSSIMMIPIVAIIQLCHTPGSLKEVKIDYQVNFLKSCKLHILNSNRVISSIGLIVLWCTIHFTKVSLFKSLVSVFFLILPGSGISCYNILGRTFLSSYPILIR